jgi:hypothetical protein
MKTYGDCTYSFTILDIGTRWRRVDSFKFPALYLLGKGTRFTLYRRLGGIPRSSGLCEVEKNLLPLPGIELQPSAL